MQQKLLYPLIVALVPLALRLMLVGDEPYSDEGLFAAESYVIHLYYTGSFNPDGWILPREGILNLYPILGSWVYFLPCEPFFLLRSLDALFAVGASIGIYRFLYEALGDRRIALVSTLLFALGMNHPAFINAGFKNSITVAAFMTALSLVWLQRCEAKRCYVAGLFMSGAILFREFFLPIGIIVSLYTMARGGWSCFWRFPQSR